MWRAFRASAVAGMAFLACGTASAQTAGNFVFSVDGVRQYLAAGQPPVAPEALEAARKDAAATGGVLRAIFVTEKIESIGQTPGMVRLQNGSRGRSRLPDSDVAEDATRNSWAGRAEALAR